MKFIIMLVIVAFSTAKAIGVVSSNTSNVIAHHAIATENTINEATR